MTYESALSKIHSSYQFTTRPGLERVSRLLKRLGNPQDNLEFIHVAGTNGKGSVSVMLAEIMRACAKKTGLYTSPFVADFRERFQINGEMISKSEFVSIAETVFSEADKMTDDMPTEFELITALAMLYFSNHKCDVVVLEVGLGGTYDATNVIQTPLASVITPVSFDHTEYLGDTLEEIAYNKAGIIKPGGITVLSCRQSREAADVIRKIAEEKNNRLIACDNKLIKSYNGRSFIYKDKLYHLSMLGTHQSENAVTAIETAKALGADDIAIRKGIEAAKLPARMELLSREPAVILDGAHNIDGIQMLCRNMRRFFSDREIIVVMAMMADKRWKDCVLEIEKIASCMITTEASNPRSLDCAELAKITGGIPLKNPYDAVRAAIAKCTDHSLVLICGSLYLAGDVRDFVIRTTN